MSRWQAYDAIGIKTLSRHDKVNRCQDYMYFSALLENYYARSPALRDRIMAAGSHLLPHGDAKDTGLAEKVNTAFA